MGFSLRYYCTKCGKCTWMKIDGKTDDEKLSVKCNECKTAYHDVDLNKQEREEKE